MKFYRITGREVPGDPDFEVEDDATEDDIAKAAADCVLENINYGWEPVPDEEEPKRPSRVKKERRGK